MLRVLERRLGAARARLGAYQGVRGMLGASGPIQNIAQSSAMVSKLLMWDLDFFNILARQELPICMTYAAFSYQ